MQAEARFMLRASDQMECLTAMSDANVETQRYIMICTNVSVIQYKMLIYTYVLMVCVSLFVCL